MKKLSLSISIALLLALMLSLVPMTVMAADYNLGAFTDFVETMSGWATPNYESGTGTMPLDTFKEAKWLVIVLNDSSVNVDNLQFIIQSEANWWAQNDNIKCVDGVINIELAAMADWAAFVAQGTQAKIVIGDWGDFWVDNSIKSAYLSDSPYSPPAGGGEAPAGGGAPAGGPDGPPPGGGEAPAGGGDAPAPEEGGAAPEGGGEVVVNEAPAGDDGKDNPKSGDSLLFPVILVALAGAAVLTVRKVRAK